MKYLYLLGNETLLTRPRLFVKIWNMYGNSIESEFINDLENLYQVKK